jgi:hypothetical protein
VVSRTSVTCLPQPSFPKAYSPHVSCEVLVSGWRLDRWIRNELLTHHGAFGSRIREVHLISSRLGRSVLVNTLTGLKTELLKLAEAVVAFANFFSVWSVDYVVVLVDLRSISNDHTSEVLFVLHTNSGARGSGRPSLRAASQSRACFALLFVFFHFISSSIAAL